MRTNAPLLDSHQRDGLLRRPALSAVGVEGASAALQHSDKVLRRTALHLASKMGKYDMVRLLVANGASLAAAGRDGYSGSHAATRG